MFSVKFLIILNRITIVEGLVTTLKNIVLWIEGLVTLTKKEKNWIKRLVYNTKEGYPKGTKYSFSFLRYRISLNSCLGSKLIQCICILFYFYECKQQLCIFFWSFIKISELSLKNAVIATNFSFHSTKITFLNDQTQQ